MLKPKTVQNKDFATNLNKSSGRVYRTIKVSDKEFKKIKLKLLGDNAKLHNALDASLLDLLKSKIKSSDITVCTEKSNRKSVSFSDDTHLKIKEYCIENDIKIENFIYQALLNI